MALLLQIAYTPYIPVHGRDSCHVHPDSILHCQLITASDPDCDGSLSWVLLYSRSTSAEYRVESHTEYTEHAVHSYPRSITIFSALLLVWLEPLNPSTPK